MTPPGGDDAGRPVVLRVVRGDATPEEIAAVLAVTQGLAAAAASDIPAARRPIPQWSAPARTVRRPLAAGRGAWRASGLPH